MLSKTVWIELDALVNEGVDIITVDIAHGDSVMMFEMLEYIKKEIPQVDVIAGNTASPGGVKGLIDNGADAVKVEFQARLNVYN